MVHPGTLGSMRLSAEGAFALLNLLSNLLVKRRALLIVQAPILIEVEALKDRILSGCSSILSGRLALFAV